MSLVYLPRIIHEKRMPKSFDPNNVVNIFLFYYTIDGIAKSVRNKNILHGDYQEEEKQYRKRDRLFSVSSHAITHPNVHR